MTRKMPVLALCAACLVALAPRPSHAADAVVGKKAPAFTLPDLQNRPRSLAEFRGRFVVLEWSNFDCPFVKKHYGSGNMQKLQKTYTGKGVAWLSICSSAPGKQGHYEPAAMLALADEKGAAPTAILLDPDGAVGKRYGAKVTPHIFIIDPDGTLIYQGAIDDIPSTRAEDVKKARNYVRMVLDAAMRGESFHPSFTRAYGCSVKYK